MIQYLDVHNHTEVEALQKTNVFIFVSVLPPLSVACGNMPVEIVDFGILMYLSSVGL